MFEESLKKKNVQMRHESSHPAPKRLNPKERRLYKILLIEIHNISVATLKGIGKREFRHDFEYE